MKLTALLLTALLLASCSSTTQESKAPKIAKVSIQTTCDRMFTQGDPRLWSRATVLVAAQSNGESVDQSEVGAVKDDLDKIGASSKPALRPHIATMSKTVAHLDSADTSDYKTAATEVANQCAAYVATN